MYCDESECCGCFGRYKNFALGFCIGLAIITAVAAVVVLLVGYGHVFHLRIAVDDASLTRFALSTTTAPTAVTSISYNLTLSLTVRNPNWAMSVAYRSLDADYLFHGQRFDSVAVVPAGSSYYVQPAKKTAVFHLATGANSAALGSAGVREFRKESGEGVFDVEVALSGEVRYQQHRTWCRLEARCPLKLQLAAAPDAGGSVVFQKTTCDVLRSSHRGC